ncbi:hypothetical protein C7S17_3822 [Burkholderia thailandensis]|nr:hypothetical protein [Burkholderia thailandensis]
MRRITLEIFYRVVHVWRRRTRASAARSRGGSVRSGRTVPGARDALRRAARAKQDQAGPSAAEQAERG